MSIFRKKNLENIKGIFEEKTGVALDETPASAAPVGRVIMVAAMLTCLLTCCAVASSLGIGESFKAFFGGMQGLPLSEGQQAYIDTRAASVGESVTQDGVTVTVKGAITDGTMAYILLDVKTGEGVVIDDRTLGFDVGFKRLKMQEEVHLSGVSATCIPLSDHDGLAHTASMVIQYTVYSFADGGFSFADGKERLLELRNFRYYAQEHPYAAQTLAEGAWEYEIAFDVVENKTVELLQNPIAASYTQISGRQVDAVITSVAAKGLSADVYYTITAGEVQEGGDFGILELVMKDGGIVKAYPEKAGKAVWVEEGVPTANGGEFYCTYAFEGPVCPEEVAALRIAGTTVVLTEP